MSVPFVLQILALICFILATFGLYSAAKVGSVTFNWLAAGLLLWLLSTMVGGWVHSSPARVAAIPWEGNGPKLNNPALTPDKQGWQVPGTYKEIPSGGKSK